jgi:hypothetical protein
MMCLTCLSSQDDEPSLAVLPAVDSTPGSSLNNAIKLVSHRLEMHILIRMTYLSCQDEEPSFAMLPEVERHRSRSSSQSLSVSCHDHSVRSPPSSSQVSRFSFIYVQTVLSTWIREGSSNQESIQRGRGSSVRSRSDCLHSISVLRT